MHVPISRRNLLAVGAATAGGILAGGAVFLNQNEEPSQDDKLHVTPTSLPKAPIAARTGHSATWTGSELAVWGGWNGDKARPHYFTDGALYSSATRLWRMMPEVSLPPSSDHLAVWSGSELLIWGGDARGLLRDGAAYNPQKNVWRALPDAPLELSAAEPHVYSRSIIFTPARYRIPLGKPAVPLLVFDRQNKRWRGIKGSGVHVIDIVADSTGVVALAFDPSRNVLMTQRLDRDLARLERATKLPLGSSVDSAGLLWSGTGLIGVFSEGSQSRIVELGDGTRWREVGRFSSRVFRSKAELHGDRPPNRMWMASGRIWSASSHGVAVYDLRAARLRSASRTVAFAGGCPSETTPVIAGNQLLMWGGRGCDGFLGKDDAMGVAVELPTR
ncbi:hypothetical protein [Streptosporangium sp. NBC_01756]|uniref:hypothetical protein n=1 Tax=Streptosporangium sp. NBC_01756 TaxID=2975950 RepID=UPI002DDA9E59|nr:hypothetical protein [Streptosporangium sp. NBC_01756]WSC85218.1 hypothetical protein OIE48_33430 [Streptosporangium sp. NBC_01756]